MRFKNPIGGWQNKWSHIAFFDLETLFFYKTNSFFRAGISIIFLLLHA